MGGIESYLLNLCSGFLPDDIMVVAPARPGYQQADAALDYEVRRLPGSYLRATRRVQRAVVEAATGFGADVVHFLAALPLGQMGRHVRSAARIPYTVIAHGTGEILVPSRVPFARRALRRVLCDADLVFPVSRFTEGAVEKVTRGEARTVVVPPSIDTERFSLDVSGASVRSQLDLAGDFVVLFVSRLVKRKGADTLIRALAGVEGADLVVVGTGPEQKALERLAREAGVEDRVIFAGGVSDEDLPAYYAAADLFCMPCSDRYRGLDTEGFGVVFLEAQASGLPCITGTCGGSVEAVVHGQTGLVLEDPTPQAVGRALERFRDDPALCAKVGAAGRLRVEREFAPEVAAGRIEEALEELVG